MPWTLQYANNPDGRITRNTHRRLFQESADVVRIDLDAHPQPRLIVYFRDEQTETADPALRRIHDEFAVRDVGTVGGGPLPERSPPIFDINFLSTLSQSAEGREMLAQSMIAPLRQRLDYQSLGRRTLLVDPLPEGARSRNTTSSP